MFRALGECWREGLIKCRFELVAQLRYFAKSTQNAASSSHANLFTTSNARPVRISPFCQGKRF
jgi:hypothetical protein